MHTPRKLVYAAITTTLLIGGCQDNPTELVRSGIRRARPSHFLRE